MESNSTIYLVPFGEDITKIRTVPALALGRVGSLPRASGLRGPHSSKKGARQAVDCSVYKIH